MKKKKSLIVCFLIFVLAVVLVSCSSPKEETEDTPQVISNEDANQKDAANKEDVKKDGYPEKTITLVVPYAAGGETDSMARMFAEAANKYIPNDQTIQVVNKTGGSGAVGLTEVFKAKPDGYTIVLTPSGPVSTQPLYGKTLYDYDSFQPIAEVSTTPMVLAVQADAPWKNFDEWMEYVKQNPGEFKYAAPGKGNPPHVTMESLNIAAGIETTVIPFKGNAPGFAALLGGHVDGIISTPQGVMPYLESGKLRVMFSSSDYSEYSDDVPSLKEKGYDVDMFLYFGILAPKGIPENVLNTLLDVSEKAIKDSGLEERFKTNGIKAHFAGPDKFSKDIKDMYEINKKVLKQIGMIE